MTGLVQLLGDWNGTIPIGGAWCELKYDGWRAFYAPDHLGQPRLWSRNGMPIEGVGHILHRLRRMEQEAGGPLFIDGEFVVDGSLAATKDWCERGHKMGGEAGVFHAFDVLALNDWRAGGGSIPLFQRKEWLKDLVEATASLPWEWRPGSRGRDDDAPAAVQLVDDEWAIDAHDVLEKARAIWVAGGEGIVVKDCEATYARKRSNAWVKVKQENMHKWSAKI